MKKIIDWFKNVVWVDKVFHFGAGVIAYFIFIRYTGNTILGQSIIFLGNCGWESFGYLGKKKEKWCWIDWFSVEFGAIATQMVYARSYLWSPIGFAVMLIYGLILFWYWRIWPFGNRN